MRAASLGYSHMQWLFLQIAAKFCKPNKYSEPLWNSHSRNVSFSKSFELYRIWRSLRKTHRYFFLITCSESLDIPREKNRKIKHSVLYCLIKTFEWLHSYAYVDAHKVDARMMISSIRFSRRCSKSRFRWRATYAFSDGTSMLAQTAHIARTFGNFME